MNGQETTDELIGAFIRDRGTKNKAQITLLVVNALKLKKGPRRSALTMDTS